MKISFFKKVLKNRNSCWLWGGYVDPEGYGIFCWKGKLYRAHRISYEFVKGKIPKNLQIDHLCRIRNCVNPGHLEAVTCRENILRGTSFAAKNAIKTHCYRGHKFIKSNLLKKKNKRVCKTCANIFKRQWRKENPNRG